MKQYYRLMNIFTGYIFGNWDTYEEADNVRMKMDDWNNWMIDEI